MEVFTLDCELVVPVSVEKTFRLFENPSNLSLITPEWMGFRILTRDPVMTKGLEIDYRFRWMGLPLRWKTLITEYRPPYCFVDEMVKGPYALWRHRHEFELVAGGTLVRDHVDYALPFGPIGRVAHRLAVGRQVTKIFDYRQRKIAELVRQTAKMDE